MASTPFTHLSHPDEAIEQIATPIPTATTSPASAGASILANAQNFCIAGGSFVTNNTTNFNAVDGLSPGPLDALHKRAAPNAILNAGGRADEVRCHPGTRQEVLSRIERWRGAQARDSQTSPIFWLSGPAGAGKTAIVQTVAERCKEQGLPQVNFFFFRTDPSRNSLSPLIATLVHQIILLYPSLRDLVSVVLSTNPLILDSILEDQLTQLIVEPLKTIRQSSPSYVLPLLMIDGLDECKSEEKRSQQRILHAFDQVLTRHSCPFLLLVSSRDEPQIRAGFREISSQLLPLYLNHRFSPESDIRAFVTDEFKRIRRVHHLAHTLDVAWPPHEDVQSIVRKSSGHFIYAATVMRFILSSPACPMLSLERVQGAAQVSNNSPFAYLDAVYTYMLSQVDDKDVLKDVLHAEMLIQEFDVLAIPGMLVELLEAYNSKYTKAVVQSCLGNLSPIAKYSDNRRLLFRHASFPDFLLDQSRSGEYFIDLNAFNFKIQPAVWKGLGAPDKFGLQIMAYPGLCRLHQLPPTFLYRLLALNPSVFDELVSGQWARGMVTGADIFKRIHNLCACDNDIMKYKLILRRWINIQPIESEYYNGLIFRRTKWPPCSHRYLAMAYIDQNFMTNPCGYMDIALRPETAFDARETAEWLEKLLQCIHREKYRDSVQEYNILLQKWMSWAVWNDIPLGRIDDLPRAQWYLRRSRVAKWATSNLMFGSRSK